MATHTSRAGTAETQRVGCAEHRECTCVSKSISRAVLLRTPRQEARDMPKICEKKMAEDKRKECSMAGLYPNAEESCEDAKRASAVGVGYAATANKATKDDRSMDEWQEYTRRYPAKAVHLMDLARHEVESIKGLVSSYIVVQKDD